MTTSAADAKKDNADPEVVFAVAEPIAASYTATVFKESKDTKCGISLFQTTPDDPVTISKVGADGLFTNTDLKIGMQVDSINGFPIDGMTRGKAISLMREAEGELTVIGKPVKGGAVATIFKESSDQNCGISLGVDSAGQVTVTNIGADGLFSATEFQVGMQVMSINNVAVEGMSKTQALSMLKDLSGKIVVVGAPPAKKAGPATSPATASGGIPPPPGAPSGGMWGKNKYVGSQTQMLMCFGCLCFGLPGLCVCFCPQDERDVYKHGNTLYEPSGKRIPDSNFVAVAAMNQPQARQMSR